MSLEEKLDRLSTLLEKVIQKMEERDIILAQGQSCLGSINQLLKGEIPIPIRIPTLESLALEEDTSSTQFD